MSIRLIIGAIILIIIIAVVWSMMPKTIDVPLESVSQATVNQRIKDRVPPKAWVWFRGTDISNPKGIVGTLPDASDFDRMKKVAVNSRVMAFSSDGRLSRGIDVPRRWEKQFGAADWYLRSDAYSTIRSQIPSAFANVRARA